jgi:hypothetical protein
LIGRDCGLPDSNCYNEDKLRGSRIPLEKQHSNLIGRNLELDGDHWWDSSNFLKQSGPLSRVMNLIPGMNSVAALHDSFYSPLVGGLPFTLSANIAGMLPAAAWSYAAVADAPAFAVFDRFGCRH